MPDLIIPKREDLYFRKELLESEKTMSFQHETIPFPESNWDPWFDRWIIDANPKDRFYRFVFCDGCNDFVALCGWEKLEDRYYLILIVDYKRRNIGYGTSIIKSLASESLKHNIDTFYAKVYLDNSAIAFLKKCGFEQLENDSLTATFKVNTKRLSQIEENWK